MSCHQENRRTFAARNSVTLGAVVTRRARVTLVVLYSFLVTVVAARAPAMGRISK